MTDTSSLMSLIGRILLAMLFLSSAFSKITNFEGTTQYMASHGMPMAQALCVGAILVEVLGGLSLVLGFKAAWGAGASEVVGMRLPLLAFAFVLHAKVHATDDGRSASLATARSSSDRSTAELTRTQVAEARRHFTVEVLGFDTSKRLVEELQEGKIDALVAQNPEKMGYLAVETLYKVVKKEKVPAMVDTGTVLVTKEKIANDPEVRKLVGL